MEVNNNGIDYNTLDCINV